MMIDPSNSGSVFGLVIFHYLLSSRISTLLQTNILEQLLSFGMVHNFRRTTMGEMMNQGQELWDSEFNSRGGPIDLAIWKSGVYSAMSM